MAYSIKSSLLAWWLAIIVSVFLWYRNHDYDRIVSALAVILGLFQLIEYGIFNNMNPHQGGKLIFSVLWLLLLILAISTFIYTKNVMSLIWLIIISTIFLFIITYTFTTDPDNFNVIRLDPYLSWTRENNTILDGLELIYLIGIIVPIVLLLNYYEWMDLGIYIILIYVISSALIVWYIFSPDLFASIWVYSLIGAVLLTWFTGMFNI